MTFTASEVTTLWRDRNVCIIIIIVIIIKLSWGLSRLHDQERMVAM